MATVWLEHRSTSIANNLKECQGRHNASDMACMRLKMHAATEDDFLKYILAISTRFDASDPRDHIFGILDLLRSAAPSSKQLFGLLAPDYTKSVKRVFRDAATFEMLTTRSLQTVRNIYHRGDDVLELDGNVSWAPQWQRTFDFHVDAYRLPDSLYDAACGIELFSPLMSSGILESGPEILLLRGFVVAVVDQTSEIMGEKTPRDVVRQGFMDIVTSHQSAEWRSSVEASNGWKSKLVRRVSGELLAADSFWLNRRFFGATGGYVGVGPRPLQTGDLVTILYGSPWPIILRPLRNGYYLLGQCAVPGIMQGEAVHEHRAENRPDKLFMLH